MNDTEKNIQSTVNRIIAECLKEGFNKSQIAYVLATVKHETNSTFKPVKEAYYLKNPDAYLKKHHPEYYPYYGRGYVQITWKYNYDKFGKLLGIDLIKSPDLALQEDVALKILVYGFKEGYFTGKKITDYINDNKTDFIKARKCINGLDKAYLIAGYANDYLKLL